eukprot:CAMPEP_0118710582 /NCGR_PEP_ID=MMETSP0800-20121206/23479_1 /TAXON_ID=210618 ORGANISM="Striatella unipunctata, Strain CCMP2910" /NCGR_SAMPLE_ID=MMETSP0800 /ASSEMBLY_ACC=CAM_ASM_000638 /LENGTH=403 /DNA_ID=CAMNT_0006614815 /DNA_START=319 /DNA_END=1530 /DNA_ORIENTATION=+
MTWGSGLEHRETQAYTWVLSKDARNLAVRASGPSYPGVCLQSMIDDEKAVYDVIVLEFFMRVEDGLLTLGKRLRERFPKAIIIFLRLWNPMHVHYFITDTTKESMPLSNWPKSIGKGFSLHDEEFKEELMQMPPGKVFFADFSDRDEIVRSVADEVDGHVVELYRPFDARVAMARYGHWFDTDWHHLSDKGHAAVAHAIESKLEQLSVDPAKQMRTAKLGSWGDGDACISWFESGDCPIGYSDGVILKAMDSSNKKHSLEIYYGVPGTVRVVNPFDEPRDLHLTYMSIGPAPSEYPVTTVEFPRTPGLEQLELDPTCYVKYGKPVHVTKTTPVGVIPPGETFVHFQVREQKTLPFRLTGISITGNEFQPKDYAFGIHNFDTGSRRRMLSATDEMEEYYNLELP